MEYISCVCVCVTMCVCVCVCVCVCHMPVCITAGGAGGDGGGYRTDRRRPRLKMIRHRLEIPAGTNSGTPAETRPAEASTKERQDHHGEQSRRMHRSRRRSISDAKAKLFVKIRTEITNLIDD